MGDSNLVVKQLDGEFSVREPTLAPYCTAQKLIKQFKKVIVEHIPRSNNRYADTLTTRGSRMLYFRDETSVA